MTNTEEKQAELVEHLAELRTRLIRTGVYVTAATSACWFFYERIFRLLTDPITGSLGANGPKFQMTNLAEGFMLRLQVCVIAGLIVAAPFLTMEAWGFVSPALTREEKRPLWWIAPFSVFLFVFGVSLCYFILPTAVRWFMAYVPPGAEVHLFMTQNLLFVVKMLLAFGLAFELPIVLMFFGKIGIINSNLMKRYWRQAIVLTALFSAIITPSPDAFSMLMMAVPLCGLFVLSILLVKIVEPK